MLHCRKRLNSDWLVGWMSNGKKEACLRYVCPGRRGKRGRGKAEAKGTKKMKKE